MYAKTTQFFRSVVRLGELDLDSNVNDEATPIDITVSRVIIHHQYNKLSTVNDIALLRLENKVTFGGMFSNFFFYN